MPPCGFTGGLWTTDHEGEGERGEGGGRCGASSLGFGDQGSGFGIWSEGLGVESEQFVVEGFDCRVLHLSRMYVHQELGLRILE